MTRLEERLISISTLIDGGVWRLGRYGEPETKTRRTTQIAQAKSRKDSERSSEVWSKREGKTGRKWGVEEGEGAAREGS